MIKKRANLLPNVITAFGLCCGLFAIFKMNMTPLGGVNHEILNLMTGILVLAAVADLLDGAVARAMKAQSEFGGLFDCISDAITFGVAPAIIVLKTLSVPPGTEFSYILSTAAMIYTVCGVLRLVRFYMLSLQSAESKELSDAHQKHFTGLPIPAAAAAIVSSNQFLVSEELNRYLSLEETTRGWILFAQLIAIGYFMISRWKFPSVKTLHIRVSSFNQVFWVVVFTVFVVFYALIQHFSVVFFTAAWGYIVVAWILSIIRLISGKKSKTLEAFEPESDDL
jgi:CDP-diacylglycerol--serine O-phosphatidyltransferase